MPGHAQRQSMQVDAISSHSRHHPATAGFSLIRKRSEVQVLPGPLSQSPYRAVDQLAKERELARAWERRHGRAPNSRELYYIARDATLQSRKGKPEGEIDWDALAQRCDATLGGELAGIAPAVSNARGPAGSATAADRGDREPVGPEPVGPEPVGQLSAEARVRVVQKALELVSEKKPTWTRHELVRQLGLVMPAQTRQMTSDAAQELLAGLADEALSGEIGDVVCLDAPQ